MLQGYSRRCAQNCAKGAARHSGHAHRWRLWCRLYQNSRAPPFQRVRALVFAVSLAGLSTGCSLQYIDDAGIRHVWGLAHIESKETQAGQSDVVAQQVMTVGVAFLHMPEQQGLSIGYTRNFSLLVNRESMAGKLSYAPMNPIDFVYQDYSQILNQKRENNRE
jgi:hypothetical protein